MRQKEHFEEQKILNIDQKRKEILSKLLVIKRHGKKETEKTQDRRQPEEEVVIVKVRVKAESDNNKEEESLDDDADEDEEEEEQSSATSGRSRRGRTTRATSSANRTAGVCGAKTGLHPDGLRQDYGGSSDSQQQSD
jgi:hypothetical protein